jgi:hypothetical protein
MINRAINRFVANVLRDVRPTLTFVTFTSSSAGVTKLKHVLNCQLQSDVESVSTDSLPAAPARTGVLFDLSHSTICTIHNRSYGFDPFVDQWPQRDFMPDPNGPGITVRAD